MVLSAAAQPAIPIILKPVLDESFVERDPSVVAGLAVLLVLTFVVWGLANWARTVVFSIVSQRVLFDLRLLMFDKLLALPIGRSDRPSVPRLMPKFTFDADRIAQAAESVFGLIDEVLGPDSGAREIFRTKGRIEFDSMGFRYRDDRPPALRNVSLVANTVHRRGIPSTGSCVPS